MRFFIRLFTSRHSFTKKISELENKIFALEARIDQINADSKAISVPSEMKKKEANRTPTIEIHHLQIDNINIEHLDYANNFGQLGIKELSGKLNIGSTYEGELPKEFKEKISQKIKKQAKVNIKAK